MWGASFIQASAGRNEAVWSTSQLAFQCCGEAMTMVMAITQISCNIYNTDLRLCLLLQGNELILHLYHRTLEARALNLSALELRFRVRNLALQFSLLLKLTRQTLVFRFPLTIIYMSTMQCYDLLQQQPALFQYCFNIPLEKYSTRTKKKSCKINLSTHKELNISYI